MATIGERLLAAAIFLAIEAPLAVIAYRASRRLSSIGPPLYLLAAGLIIPDDRVGGFLLLVSVLWMFSVAIRLRIRKTHESDERELAARGPSPWIGQSRRSSLALIVTGTVLMLLGSALDPIGHAASAAAALLFGGGSIALGMGLFRRHPVLVHYLGRAPARRLEVIQVAAAVLAYTLVAVAEFSGDAGQRLTFRLASLIPFGIHFLLVWIPLAKAQERPVLPETPFV